MERVAKAIEFIGLALVVLLFVLVGGFVALAGSFSPLHFHVS